MSYSKRPRVCDATDEEARAEAELLREEREEADRIAAPFFWDQVAENDLRYLLQEANDETIGYFVEPSESLFLAHLQERRWLLDRFSPPSLIRQWSQPYLDFLKDIES